MTSWIDWRAVWEIVVVGLLAGAGLPVLFAIGVHALALPGKGRPAQSSESFGSNPAGLVFAVLCFAIVLAAVGFGIYIVVASGHK